MSKQPTERWLDPFPWKCWLEPFPWEAVVDFNRQFCSTAKTTSAISPEGHSAAKALWEKTRPTQQSLHAAFDLCRECYRSTPFQHYNGDTFASIARALSQQVCEDLKTTKANIFYSAVGHYVTGTMELAEFDKIYTNIGKALISGDTEPLNPASKK